MADVLPVPAGVEDADVELLEDQIVGNRRPEAVVVPGVVAGSADDAVDLGVAVPLQLAGTGVALVPLPRRTDGPELVERAIGHAGKEAGPMSIRVADEPALLPGPPRFRLRLASGAPREIDGVRGRRPDLERGTAGDEVHPRRSVRSDVVLGGGHEEEIITLGGPASLLTSLQLKEVS